MGTAPSLRHRLEGVVSAKLAHPRLPRVAALLAVILSLPALTIGWHLDDHFHRFLLGREGGVSALQMFSITLGRPEAVEQYRDLGAFPWWIPDDFRLAFLRPLSVLTLRLDYRLWPESPALMHAHSLLWLGLLVLAAATLYRRILGPAAVAGLAALLYAVDDAHAVPAAWLANRNALIATLFGVLALLAHDRWRRGGWRPGSWVGPLCLATGLAAGETALAAFGYLAAHALLLEEGAWRRRLAALAPHGVVLASWAALYRLLGYGAHGSGLYIDPRGQPLRFVAALGERVPFLLLGQWSPLPAELGSLLPPPARDSVRWLALAFLALLATLLLPLLRRSATARFWALGMILSTVPLAATFPSNRLLLFTGLGAMGLLAQWLAGWLQRPVALPASRPWRLLGGAAAVVLIPTHLLLAPLAAPLAAYSTKLLGEPMLSGIRSLPEDPALGEQTLVVVSAPDYLTFVTQIPTLRVLEGKPLPERIRGLSAGPTALELSRLDERTLRLHLERGLFAGTLGRLFRGEDHPLAVGDRVRLTGFEATVAALGPDGAPNEVIYHFDRPLEDPALRWVRWDGGAYVAWIPPAPGRTIHLPPARGPFEMLVPEP